MTIDVGGLAAWVGALGVIFGALAGFYKLLDKHLLKRLAALETRIEETEKWNRKQQADISTGMGEKQLLMEGVLACLDGLKQLACNGAVTAAHKKLSEFLVAQAHQTKSKDSAS